MNIHSPALRLTSAAIAVRAAPAVAPAQEAQPVLTSEPPRQYRHR
ncbi:hypothetical protein [Leifsonia sp. EB34]